MKSIKRLFEKTQKENPQWGPVVVFNHIVYGKNFSKDRITRTFNELVDKSEYLKSEKKDVLEYLYLQNKPLKRTKNEGKLPHIEEITTEMEIDYMGKDKDGIDDTMPRSSNLIDPKDLPY